MAESRPKPARAVVVGEGGTQSEAERGDDEHRNRNEQPRRLVAAVPEQGEAPAPVRKLPAEVEPQVRGPVAPVHGRDFAASYCALKGKSAGSAPAASTLPAQRSD